MAMDALVLAPLSLAIPVLVLITKHAFGPVETIQRKQKNVMTAIMLILTVVLLLV